MVKTSLPDAGAAAHRSGGPVPRDSESFHRAANAHRQDLIVHCYRLLGSLADAEDMVQDTLVRAWRALGRFQGKASFRNWLYRIATNVCLDHLAQRSRVRRVFPADLGGPTRRLPKGPPSTEIPWIEPLPDLLVEGVADAAPGPSAQYERRETVRLAFIGATQHLPPRQRAVLLLRDVLGWSAQETAVALQLTLAAVTSALQRARATLSRGLSREDVSDAAGGEAAEAAAGAYVQAWERQDIPGLVALLARDATLSMPPWSMWYAGRAQVGSLFKWAWRTFSQGGQYKLVQTRSNSQVAFGTYLRIPGEATYQAHVLQVLTFRKGKISQITLFVNPQFHREFKLPAEIPARP